MIFDMTPDSPSILTAFISSRVAEVTRSRISTFSIQDFCATLTRAATGTVATAETIDCWSSVLPNGWLEGFSLLLTYDEEDGGQACQKYLPLQEPY